MSHPDISGVLITDALDLRPPPIPNYLLEKVALQDLAHQMAEYPAEVLPRLVKLAMELCAADSAGISVLEGQEFRWLDLSGRLSDLEDTRTPRGFSPCGVCIDSMKPVLMERPERAYQWIAEAGITIPEVLLVPLQIKGSPPLGTLWVVAEEGQHFHSGDARVMMELAVFTGVALKMIQSEKELRSAVEQRETLALEMSHRVKNLFAVTSALVEMAARHSSTKEEMRQSLSARLRALADAHALIKLVENDKISFDVVSLNDVIEATLKPYKPPVLNGPDIALGERAINSLALAFHELATNSAKYGAYSRGDGEVQVSWTKLDESLVLTWREIGAAHVVAPRDIGYGTRLILGSIQGLGGTIEKDWNPDGMVAHITLPLIMLRT